MEELNPFFAGSVASLLAGHECFTIVAARLEMLMDILVQPNSLHICLGVCFCGKLPTTAFHGVLCTLLY